MYPVLLISTFFPGLAENSAANIAASDTEDDWEEADRGTSDDMAAKMSDDDFLIFNALNVRTTVQIAIS